MHPESTEVPCFKRGQNVYEVVVAVVTSEKTDRLSFGLFEVDLLAGELWKAGLRVRLAGQPFKVLLVLLEHQGEVVTREELQSRIWGSNTNVDFERALAGTVNKIREALGDSAENPRFIETLTKRGYRFIAPVTVLSTHRVEAEQTAVAVTSPTSPVVEQAPGTLERVRPIEVVVPARAGSRREWWAFGAAGVLLLLLLATLWLWRQQAPTAPAHIEQVTHFVPISSGPQNVESFLVLATDGDRIMTSVMVDGRPRLSAIFISTGEVQQLSVPREVATNSLADLSRDGSRLLLRSLMSSESEQPLWVMPSAGGSGLRISNVLAHDATWMPDGRRILYATGNEMWVVGADGGTPSPYVKLEGRAFWMRWSPDGKLLRFTLMDPVTHSANLWELESGDKTPRLVQRVSDASPACCGTWTADGSAYIFEGNQNLWELKGRGRSASLAQLTNGPLHFFSPVAARSGAKIYFLGLEPPSGLQVFSEQRHEFQTGAGVPGGRESCRVLTGWGLGGVDRYSRATLACAGRGRIGQGAAHVGLA